MGENNTFTIQRRCDPCVTTNEIGPDEAADFLLPTIDKGDTIPPAPFVYGHCYLNTLMRHTKGAGIKYPWDKRLMYGKDMTIILREARKLLMRHGLPMAISRAPFLIEYSDAVLLRRYCEKIRKRHWNFISSTKLKFRNVAWKHMHVEEIPCGNLQSTFAVAFNVYLPLKSHLPVENREAILF